MADLTPDQVLALQRAFLQGNTNPQNGYSPIYIQSGDNSQPNQLLGFGGNYSGYTPGSTYDLYGTDGSSAGQRQVENGGSVGDLLKTTVGDLKTPAALFAALYGAGSLLNGGFLGFGGGGAGNAVGGVTGLPSGADASAFWDMGPASAGGAGTATMGAGAATGAAGAGGGAAGTTSTAAGTASSLIPSGSSLLGPAATLLGAVAGSQGQKNTSTETRSMTPELKPYVFGQGGLLDAASNYFKNQVATTPAEAQQIKSFGLGLLGPVAGNGFARFYGG